jgi:Trk K+ transport system NAD-binding subunit
MKFPVNEFAFFLRGQARKNLKLLVLYCFFLFFLVMVYATLFTVLMEFLEGRHYSLITGIYWAIVAMTTLGYGDIVFTTDVGFLFSAIVTFSGVVFMLILLPFGMVSLFLAPWIEQRLRYRPKTELPEDYTNHVVIFGYDVITRALIRRLIAHNTPYVVVSSDHDQAMELEEEGLHVVVGSPTSVIFLKNIKVDKARHLVTNLTDPQNTNICLTVRSFCDTPIATMVDEPERGELLRAAGANRAIPLKRILGSYLASRATTLGATAHILDAFGKLLIAEMPVKSTPFVGQTLAEAQIRQRTGLAVIGLWERGTFTVPEAGSVLSPRALMMLAGTREQLHLLENITSDKDQTDLVMVLGHGRIGCSAARYLERRGIPFVIIDRNNNLDCMDHISVIGDATNRHLLQESGIDDAKGLIVTTNDDSTNIFLTLASRRQRRHMRIVARSNQEENVEQLYAAGADFVISNASVGANILSNVLEGKETIFLTEGIDVFRTPLPPSVVGKTIAESQIRPKTGCSIVALELPGATDPLVSPAPETELQEGMVLILIGSPDDEESFSRKFRSGP